jgi:hypothetical protein
MFALVQDLRKPGLKLRRVADYGSGQSVLVME